MGGGTKTHAGANVGVRRTEAKKYCPQMNVGGRAAANLADIKSALKVLGGLGGACICVANHANVACHV